MGLVFFFFFLFSKQYVDSAGGFGGYVFGDFGDGQCKPVFEERE